MSNPDLQQVLAEKKDLENNLKTLTNEVEFLSNKNADFLKELRTKDFYDVYRQQSEELNKLREAHTLLISMIHSKEV